MVNNGESLIIMDSLLGGEEPPLWKMMDNSSVGMMIIPNRWKNNPAMFQTTNQLYYLVDRFHYGSVNNMSYSKKYR